MHPIQPYVDYFFPMKFRTCLDKQCEERTIIFLDSSRIHQEFPVWKEGKDGGKKKKKKKHQLKWLKRPTAIPGLIIECLDEELREDAIRALGNFLVEKRKEDPDNYRRTGFMVFYSCATMCILLQELVSFLLQMTDGMLNARSMRRIVNVLTLLQSVAANLETRQKFVETQIPLFLVPMICFRSTIELFDNVRAVAISVIGILCQGRDTNTIKWALDNEMIDACCTVLDIGNELSKVIALHIIELILRSEFGINFLCNPSNEKILNKMVKSWNDLVIHLANDQNYSLRILFHVVRCYFILCTQPRGIEILAHSLPKEIKDNCFRETIQEFPVMKGLLCQLNKIVFNADI